MKSIVVISDTHGNFSKIDKLMPILKESDFVFHLGDCSSDILAYRKEIGEKLYFVHGNCDGGGQDCVVNVEGVKVLLTHGDKYGVKQSLTSLYLRAKEIGARLVFYGHTHIPDVVEQDGIKFVNPGCMSNFSQNSYCYAVVHDNKIIAKIVPI